jgi:hypothetical protein
MSARWARLGMAAMVCLGLTAIGPAGQAQDTVRVRGTIERLDGDLYLVKSRQGDELKIKLAPNATVVATEKAAITDVKPGSYIGVTGVPHGDGSQRAVEIHIFPEAMRGTGEGHRAWDLQPQSTMTNATVDAMVSAADGHSITLKHKDGETRVMVSSTTVIVVYAPGSASELKPGAVIFISAAAKQADGTLLAQRVTVGRGLPPPM